MSGMDLQDTEVAAYLRSRNVLVIDEWTVECLDWLKQEYQDQNVTASEMKQFVYDQWLDSDLKEIAAPAFPQILSQQKKLLLTGNYALQINSVQDVSSPAYGQLVKLQGKENENALVCATQQTQPTQNKFETKSNRMLMLQLTDGHQMFEGMEYQSIPGLSVDTPPGTKILVSGTVQCRQGLLFLTAKNTQVLGGDVDSLAEENSKIQILCNALGVDGSQVSQQEPVQTASDRQEPAILDTINLTVNTQGNSHVLNTNTHRSEVRLGASGVKKESFDENAGFSDDLGDELDALMLNEIQQIEELDRIQQQTSSADEEWPADEDIDERWLEQVEETHSVQEHRRQKTPKDMKVSLSSLKDVKKAKVETSRHSAGQSATGAAYPSKANKASSWESKVRSCEPSEVKDMKTRLDLAESMSIGNSGRMNRDATLDRVQTEPAFKNSGASSKLVQKPGGCAGSFPAVSSKLDTNSVNARSQSSIIPPDALESRTHPGQSSNATCIPKEIKKTLTKVDTKSQQRNQASRPTATHHSNLSRSSNAFQKLKAGSGKPAIATGIAVRISKDPSLSTNEDKPKRSSSATISSVDTQSPPSGSAGSGVESLESISAAKRRRFHSNEGVVLESFPVVKLSSVMDKIQAKDSFTFSIKGFVVTLLSPLSRKDGYWSITAKISDTTASHDVELSNGVLTQLIGFSVPEMMQMKKSIKSSEAPKAKELEMKLRTGLAQCQKLLIDMHCPMTISVRTDQQLPLVTAVGNTDPEDIATNFREVPNKH